LRWATRAGVHVDRAASAWLIRRFVDPEAEFIFVDDPDDVPGDATPFDMIGVDLTHHGDKVTFESILDRHHLDDRILHQLGRIIHEADVADDLYDAPEAAGLDAIIRGLSLTEDDEELIVLTRPLFDGLYALLHRRHSP
jgi:hypothetical protein